MTTISESDKRKLRKKANDELLRLESCISDQDTIEALDTFKNKFNVCETIYKVILAEYLRKQQKKKINKSVLTIKMNQVLAALKFAGYSIDKNDEELLSKIFGGSSKNRKKGDKSAKVLRNATTHGFDKTAVDEIVERKEELIGNMDTFLSMIRDFDRSEDKADSS